MRRRPNQAANGPSGPDISPSIPSGDAAWTGPRIAVSSVILVTVILINGFTNILRMIQVWAYKSA